MHLILVKEHHERFYDRDEKGSNANERFARRRPEIRCTLGEERCVAWRGRCIELVWRRCTSETLVLTFHSATKMPEPVLSLHLSLSLSLLPSIVTERPARRLTSTRFPPIVPNWDRLSFPFFPPAFDESGTCLIVIPIIWSFCIVNPR